jgi:predicted nucleic acid-binding protein
VAGYFFDSSALVKRYVAEVGTGWVKRILHPATRNAVDIARITAVEVVSALARRARGGSISPTAAAAALRRFRRELTTRFSFVPMSPRLLGEAMIIARTHALRGYDAVQLAAALRVNFRRRARGISGVTLVSSDHALLAAAQAEGLLVEDPNAHP